MEKNLCVIGIIFAVVAVVLGALGAHALKDLLTEAQLDSFETGLRYQMYHALALIVFSSSSWLSKGSKKILALLFSIGILLFSISIYLLATASLLGMSLGFLGPITPLGGLLLISGWIFALWKIISYKSANY